MAERVRFQEYGRPAGSLKLVVHFFPPKILWPQGTFIYTWLRTNRSPVR